MDIRKVEIKDLKVMAYDILASIQKLQNDLVAINNIIAQKTTTQQTARENKKKPEPIIETKEEK